MVGFSVDFDKVVSAPLPVSFTCYTNILWFLFSIYVFLHHFRSKLNYLNYRIFWEWFSYPEMNYLLLTIFIECIWTSFSGKHNQISVIGNQYREDVLTPTAIKPQRVKRVLDVQKKVNITLIFPIDIWHFKQVFFGLSFTPFCDTFFWFLRQNKIYYCIYNDFLSSCKGSNIYVVEIMLFQRAKWHSY